MTKFTVSVRNGYLVIDGQLMVRTGAIIAVFNGGNNGGTYGYQRRPVVVIRHGGKGFSSPTLEVQCNSYEESAALHEQVATVLTTRDDVRAS